jgi:hypothetical protein
VSNTDRIKAALDAQIETQRAALDQLTGLANLTTIVYLNPHGDEVVMRPETKSGAIQRRR